MQGCLNVGVFFAWVVEGDEFWLATVMAYRDLAVDAGEKGVYSLEGVLARATPTKIHANFLRAVP